MQRENPLPLFFSLLFLFLLSKSHTAVAQISPPDSTQSAREQRLELQRIKKLTRFGPHYKNPNAAGRLLTFNRAVPSLPADYAPVRLTGPAYKNRKPTLAPVDTTKARPAARPRLYGPRYKNRGAKTGNL